VSECEVCGGTLFEWMDTVRMYVGMRVLRLVPHACMRARGSCRMRVCEHRCETGLRGCIVLLLCWRLLLLVPALAISTQVYAHSVGRSGAACG
jgi:hypothetical protein